MDGYVLHTDEAGEAHTYGPMKQELAEELGKRLRQDSSNGTALEYKVLQLESALKAALDLPRS